jgi:phosphoglycerate kinase
LGRPKGKTPQLSLKLCAKRLSELLGIRVQLAPDCIGSEVEKMAEGLQPGQILLLENLRFHGGEEHPNEDPDFAKSLARLGDVYVNDAFGTAHRAHASTAIIAKYFPGKSAAGFLMDKEIQFLSSTLLQPAHPFYAIIGGAKISSKIGVLKALLEKVDALLVGGGMAYTFLKAQGKAIGDSIHEDDLIDEAKDIIETCRKKNVKLLLPIDHVIADKPVNGAASQIIETDHGIPAGYQGVDIGPKTIEAFTKQLQNAKLVFWNGPLGVFEQTDFSVGTRAIAQAIANLPHATTIVGGGDSIAAIEAAGVSDKISHLSTGGGATLEFIEFGTLPGIEALSPAKARLNK